MGESLIMRFFVEWCMWFFFDDESVIVVWRGRSICGANSIGIESLRLSIVDRRTCLHVHGWERKGWSCVRRSGGSCICGGSCDLVCAGRKIDIGEGGGNCRNWAFGC